MLCKLKSPMLCAKFSELVVNMYVCVYSSLVFVVFSCVASALSLTLGAHARGLR